ncbi:N-formylglutamate amidohydrolase [Lysobacter sp. SG-8]|uniref:N-formylglutamate amidohydrolase n=1 Tax=Marilutibacter penaei TaxID=2759900 RepID=A0A7W3YED2_9GAMM|nr:N-formylglutamate amidohydrolase [Lysobacter penaei]MBB1088022.1 N-formylglutamate amidohydrolase [Lysobacter penaei]
MDGKSTDTPAGGGFFTRAAPLALARPDEDWDLVLGDGPVIATAIHDGHAMRTALLPHLAVDDAGRRREEDPLTGALVAAGDVRLRVRASRFQVDLNRPRALALSTDPADTWGLRVWKGALPEAEVATSLAAHDRFYAMFRELVDTLLQRFPALLVLDIHSYNHRRDGAGDPPAPEAGNPDIDVGATTLDRARWGHVAKTLAAGLRAHRAGGRELDVRENVRYDGGGHFPEWLHATWPERVCAISLEYKKVYMDEWTGSADIAVLDDLRRGLEAAVASVRGEFLP